MSIVADERVMVTQAAEKPALPLRPAPHERDGRQPVPQPTRPHPQVRGGLVRPEDDQARALLTTWYGEYAPMVQRVVARSVRFGDVDLVDDLAQVVWIGAWQYLLRGNEVRRPAGLLAQMARARVIDHYRLARVRREELTDFQEYERAVDRLASWLGAAA